MRKQMIRLAFHTTDSGLRSELLRILVAESKPPHWDEFIKARYEGGKKKVTNTNPKTKDRFHQVTMQTLFKSDDGFKKRVMKEYADWMDAQSESGKKAPPSSKKKPSTQPIPSDVLGSHEDVDAYLKKHSAFIGEAVALYQSAQQTIDPYYDSTDLEKQFFTPDVQNLAVTSGDIGNDFSIEFQETFDEIQGLFIGWRDSSLSNSGRELQDWVAGKPTTLSDKQKEALRDQYLFTQAFFKKAGITHVTLFRGIRGQEIDKDPPSEGDAVDLGTRSLSSWSMNLNIAKGFGNRCCIARVPVEQIFASPLTDPRFGYVDETEFILMPEKGKAHIPVTLGGLRW